MKITFFSNYLNHHQFLFCKALYDLTDGEFRFVADRPIVEERLKLGYKDMNREDFVIRSYEDEEQREEAKRLMMESDVVIHAFGFLPYVEKRLLAGKMVFRYTERLFKKTPSSYLLNPKKLYSFYRIYQNKKHKDYRVLCASAFVPVDLKKFGLREEQFYKFGYFPEVKIHENPEDLIAGKKKNSLLWCGRFLDWKHPESFVQVAKFLKKEGLEFHLNVIGTGNEEEKIKKMIQRENLEGEITLLGSMSPSEVRTYMEESEIFLFTSDRQEGWGAVLNESMNSACAVVASSAIGSVPFLVREGENGLIYQSGNTKQLCEKVKELLLCPEKRKEISKNAYLTLEKVWNPDTAAERFLRLAEVALAGKDPRGLFEDGVLSPASIIKDPK